MRLLPCFAVALLLPACASTESATDDVTGTAYYEMTSRLSSADLARWKTDSAALQNSFYDVCGDTFCSGDYSNLTTVALACSITQADYVKECTWALAGSIEYVDGATGKFTIDARTFPCTIPVKTKLSAFLGALEGDASHSIHTALPGTGQSFYDGIGACLSGVVGNLPPPNTGTTYEELADYFNEHGDPGDWYGTRGALNGAFEAACDPNKGFCKGSAYPELAPLRFVCATNTSTAQVVGCKWTIAGAEVSVNSKGHVAASMKLFQCPVSTHGAASALETALSGSTPLHTKLPGVNAYLDTQLDACL